MQWELNKQRYLSEAEIEKLFSTVRHLEFEEQVQFRHYWKRVHMMLNMVFNTGMRVSEISSVKHKDLDLEDQLPSIFVVGKRKRRRYIPLNRKLVEHIQQFIKWKENYGLDTSLSASFLPSMKYQGKCMSVSGLEAMYVRALKEAGIARRTFHSARHSFGFRVYNATKDLKAVAQLLGHSSTSVSEIYTFCTWDKLSGYVNEMAK